MTIVNKQKGVDLNMESSNGVANATKEATGLLLRNDNCQQTERS